MKKLTLYLLSTLSLSGIVTSCAGIKNQQINAQLEKSNCNQISFYSYMPLQVPQPIDQIKIDNDLQTLFSKRNLNLANAIGAIELLKEYMHLKKNYREDHSSELRMDLLECSQRIYQRINISSLEISAVASEMDCEEERADQISGYLRAIEDDLETKLTVGGLVLGASGAIASGFLVNKGNTGDYLGVGTGIAGAAASLLILTGKKKIEFHHKRNPLGDIWTGGATSSIFPPAVWYYLNYENTDGLQKESLRIQTKKKWMELGLGNDKKSKNRENLFFGTGGRYTAEQLAQRADMLDQVESLVNLMKQDLKELTIALEEIDTKKK